MPKLNPTNPPKPSPKQISRGDEGEIYFCMQDDRLNNMEGDVGDIKLNIQNLYDRQDKGLAKFLDALETYTKEIINIVTPLQAEIKSVKKDIDQRITTNGKQDQQLDQDANDIDALQERVARLEENKADKSDVTKILSAISGLQITVNDLKTEKDNEKKDDKAAKVRKKERLLDRKDKIVLGALLSIIGIVITQAVVFFIKTFVWGF